MAWQRVLIPLSLSAFVDPGTGEIVEAADPSATVPHWCDLTAALRWLQHADRLRQHPASMGDGAAFWRWQQSLFEAVANVFNALNVPWQNHPTSRAVYRRFIAGPPAGDNDAQQAQSIYNSSLNYANGDAPGSGWFNPAQWREPRWPTALYFGGAIPRAASDWINTRIGMRPDGRSINPGMFFQSFGLRLGISRLFLQSSSLQNARYLPPLLAQEAINTIFPFNGYDEVYDGLPGYAWTQSGVNYFGVPGRFCANIHANTDCSPQEAVRGTQWIDRPNGTRQQGEWVSPDATWYDTNFLGGWFFAPAPTLYTQWILDWIDLLLAEAGRQQDGMQGVIARSIRFAVHINQQQMRYSGLSDQQFLARATNVPMDVFNTAASRSAGWQVAGAISGAIGAAAAPFTMGISALLASGIALGADIVSRLAPKSYDNAQKDDLGQWKPTIERTSLGGDITNETARGAPTFTIPEPPAITGTIGTIVSVPKAALRSFSLDTVPRQALINDDVATAQTTSLDQQTSAVPETSNSNRISRWVAPLAVGVGAVALGGAAAVFWRARHGK